MGSWLIVQALLVGTSAVSDNQTTIVKFVG
jgi:hypothetical protein